MPPQILGILNITTDSFSDGGRFIRPDAANFHIEQLAKDGADIIDIGAVSSNPDGDSISTDQEISRIEQVLPAVMETNCAISIDSFKTETQRHFLGHSAQISYLNDISGFSDVSFHSELADSNIQLIVMHSVQSGRATIVADTSPHSILNMLYNFFDKRINQLLKAGVHHNRIILDPGMGHFLGKNPDCSIEAIRAIPLLKQRYNMPVLASVSRKSFLGAITGKNVLERQAASLTAEICCLQLGANYIRTHEPRQLKDATMILNQFDFLLS